MRGLAWYILVMACLGVFTSVGSKQTPAVRVLSFIFCLPHIAFTAAYLYGF